MGGGIPQSHDNKTLKTSRPSASFIMNKTQLKFKNVSLTFLVSDMGLTNLAAQPVSILRTKL